MGQAMGRAKLQEMAIEFARRSRNSGMSLPFSNQDPTNSTNAPLVTTTKKITLEMENGEGRPTVRSIACEGVPGTEQEHRIFLLGLQKLGKGDWRGVSRNYSGDTPMESHDFFAVNPPQVEARTTNPLPAPPALDEECESMDSTSNDSEQVPQKPDSLQCCYPVVIPAYILNSFHFLFHFGLGWLQNPLKRRHMRCLSQQQYI
ncbi:hypothetical protein Vadar_033960 [Vaccinium darrowii]|uniref:Uncharacterized protein n=1 Tax=Vaccinium darrowii TaxID=229202 RepID=A0ACB7ZGM9_9ERIC|nr:hypothetical protein Vadar_033960 [Vaccinium darrowii]